MCDSLRFGLIAHSRVGSTCLFGWFGVRRKTVGGFVRDSDIIFGTRASGLQFRRVARVAKSGARRDVSPLAVSGHAPPFGRPVFVGAVRAPTAQTANFVACII